MRVSPSTVSNPTLGFRASREVRDRVLKAAAKERIPYSHWLRRVVEEALKAHSSVPSLGGDAIPPDDSTGG